MDDPKQRESALIRDAILIAGATASGKSALAIDIARRTGGLIVNADSMQVYDTLRIITARPGPDELAAADHRLYGYVDPAAPHSVGAWLRDVAKHYADQPDRRMIFVGGTGLYLRALVDEFSEMPTIPPHLRERWRYKLHEEGPDRLHRVLRREDPRVADMLRPSDGQRIVRALEVLEASGESILDWQARSRAPLVDRQSARMRVLEVDRATLIERIDRRFDRMVADGGVGEVETLLARKLDPAVPAMKAIGIREIGAALAGHTRMAEAVERAKIATRQYARRQETWFRNQFGVEWVRQGTV